MKDSGTFKQVLHEDLGEYQWAYSQRAVFQYVLQAPDLETCQEATRDLLQELSQFDY